MVNYYQSNEIAICADTICYSLESVQPFLLTRNVLILNMFRLNANGVIRSRNVKCLNSSLNCAFRVYNGHGENVYSSIGYQVP